ncbi:hypothetical protein [Alistipes sp. ZOR0009]|uniref:hypothetical protein n=1 Tax=Alistipes sp. ZOR0009 TaxID=1339253 RepID=UPI000648BB41|nr:hypothetical protein [Alistipes sp. ZOR0009]
MKSLIIYFVFISLLFSCSEVREENFKEKFASEGQSELSRRKSLGNADFYSYLGFGVKDVTDEITTNKIFIDNFLVRPVDCSEQSEWDYIVTTNESELRDKVEKKFSTSAKAGYAGFSFSASYEKMLTQETVSKSNSIVGVAIMKIVKGEISMAPFEPSFKNSIQESIYKSRNPADFRQKFGDKFISGAVLGGVVMVKFEFTNVSFSNSTSSTVKMSAEAAFKSMISTKVSFEEVKSQYSEFKNSTLKINCTSGGPILNFTDNIGGVSDIINKAIADVDQNKNLTRILNRYTFYKDIINDYPFVNTTEFLELKNQWVFYRSNLINVEPCFIPNSDKHTEIVKKIIDCNNNLTKISKLETVNPPANDAKRTCLMPCDRNLKVLGNLSGNFKISDTNIPYKNLFERDVYIFSNSDIFPDQLVPLYAVSNKNKYIYSTSSNHEGCEVNLVGYIFRSYHEGAIPLVEREFDFTKTKLGKVVGFPSYRDENFTISGNSPIEKGILGYVVENPNLLLDI